MSTPDEKISMLPRTPCQEITRLLIAEAAYYRAEKRGFASGHEDEDWLEAEKEIKIYLSSYFDFLSMH